MKYYSELTKSGLVIGNLITVIGGFMLGMHVSGMGGFGEVNWEVFIATLVGIYLVMASGCVFNNYIDRDIDAHMERTKHRALVTHRVRADLALMLGAMLGAAGFLILTMFANPLAFVVAFAGFFFYVVMYSLWWKRRSPYGTAVGAIAGATPPVVGYAAATGRLDLAALLVFLIMLVWQMPHFFAIAIRRQDDYAAAKVPVLPVAQGVKRTKRSMLIYIFEFTLAALTLFLFGYEGSGYLIVVLGLAIMWFALGAHGIKTAAGNATRHWARQMFIFSLVVLVVLFGAMALLA